MTLSQRRPLQPVPLQFSIRLQIQSDTVKFYFKEELGKKKKSYLYLDIGFLLMIYSSFK